MFKSDRTEWLRYLETTTESYESQTVSSVVWNPMMLGTVSLLITMVFFAFAIHYEWVDDIAPRTANRPKAIMKNAILHGISDRYKNKLYVYPFAFLRWAYNLTYKECLAGIPGTGTRKDGWEGPLLKTNLDAVIFLKYHTLLFKISLMVALLCSFALIPINVTAGCDPAYFGLGTCALHNNQTGFVSTTIAHIPDKIYNNDTDAIVTSSSISISGIFDSVLQRPNATSADQLKVVNTTDGSTTTMTSENEESISVTGERFWIPNQTWRIVVTCASCVVIYVYTMYLVWQEWVENVALRRAFFLEASHYGQRMIELNKLDLDFVKKKKKNDDYGYNGNSSSEQYNRNESRLPPHVTHPEVRETPPSIGLYSVLYQLPNSMVTYDTDGASMVERQLVATTKFFDMVVPPQPGYSSSVIAVTMIPHAKLVANCWKKWNIVEKKLQTLRHIRYLLAKAESVPKEDVPKEDESVIKRSGNTTKLYSERGDGDIETLQVGTTEEPGKGLIPGGSFQVPQVETFKYEDFDVKVYARSLGFSDEVDKVSGFVDGMGIEEFNVFAYTCALLAGGPGFGLAVLNLYDVKKLREAENRIMDELDDAHQELMNARSAVVMVDDDEAVPLDEEISDAFPSVAGLNNGSSMKSYDVNDEWGRAENEFANSLKILGSPKNRRSSFLRNEKAKCCSGIKGFAKRVMVGPDIMELDPKYYGLDPEKDGKVYKTDAKHPSYAVITFASRHSAIVARQCLADGVASNNWIQVDNLPLYPLADAPENMYTYPKGFMKPVTLTISYTSKKIRKWIVSIFLIFFLASYTALLNLINRVLWDPELYEGLFGLSQETLDTIIPTLSGLTQTMLFSVCPQIFKFVAYKEGSATSLDDGEKKAMIYFWYFYLVVRYLGQLVVDSIQIFARGENRSIEQIVLDALSELAKTAPTILGPFALTWIIFAATITWPIVYFVNFNNFWTSWFRLTLINRILKGGGPGQELSYRIYVDSAYVLSCIMALAPVCPLIGPFACLYFILVAPMVRFLVVFAYRPKFDSGGDKWPSFYHMIITSVLLGQIVVTLTFLLKGNYVAGIILGLCLIPTLIFNSIVLEKFSRPFRDASLRFTGKIYKRAYENHEGEDPWREREEFRRWLVDCHKASYLPTCLSGDGTKNLLTAEPAIVIPKPKRVTDESAEDHYSAADKNMRNLFQRQTAQKGGIMRRQRFGI